MSGNTFGKLFTVTTWGESHGPAVGCVVCGCPAGMELSEQALQPMLDRRRPGRSAASTARREEDRVRILSGVFRGKTTGTPISLILENKDARSKSYDHLENVFRPGHGDYTYQAKYGIRDHRGGGRASARETAARVAAGAVAALVIGRAGMEVSSLTLAMGGVWAKTHVPGEERNNPFLCPDPEAAKAMEKRVREVKKAGDSIGGVVQVRATGVPPGLGEPVFDKLDAELAWAMMSIGAVKGVEIGSGFAAAEALGSENNDPVTPEGFAKNDAGGVLAGISSGQDIVVRVAVKPIPSIEKEQDTVDTNNRARALSISGRHDVCAIPRINVVCEAMACLVLADFLLRHRAAAGFFSKES
ncbi:MAG: chorismate synthase [Deltaproteobacteria bacterium]|nr:chorismate synthase [Deltaproteobacteria bacterium]